MAQKGNMKEYGVRLKLDMGTAQKQVEQVTQDVREMIANLSTAEDKFSVFKQLAKYLSDLDKQLVGLKNKNADLFDSIFGANGKVDIDTAITNALKSITDVPKQIADILEPVLSGISNAGKIKGATDNIQELANAINILYAIAEQEVPFKNISELFGGKVKFEDRIASLTTALQQFRVEWDKTIQAVGGGSAARSKEERMNILEAVRQKRGTVKASNKSSNVSIDDAMTNLFGSSGKSSTVEGTNPPTEEMPTQNIEAIGDAARESAEEVAAFREEMGKLGIAVGDLSTQKGIRQFVKDVAKIHSKAGSIETSLRDDELEVSTEDTLKDEFGDLSAQLDAIQKKYGGIIATMEDGTKRRLSFSEFNDTLGDDVKDLFKKGSGLKDIELVSSEIWNAQEAYEALEDTLKSLKRTNLDRFSFQERKQVRRDLKNYTYEIKKRDPEFKYGSRELFEQGRSVYNTLGFGFPGEPFWAERVVPELQKILGLTASNNSNIEEAVSARQQEQAAVEQTNQDLQEQATIQQQINDETERTSRLSDDAHSDATPEPPKDQSDATVHGDISSVVTKQMEELRKLEEYLKQLQGLVNTLFSNITPPDNVFEPLKADIDHIESSVNNIVSSLNSIKGFATQSNMDNPDDATLNVDFASLFAPIRQTLDQIYGVLKGFTGVAAKNQDSVEYKKPAEQTRAAEGTKKAVETQQAQDEPKQTIPVENIDGIWQEFNALIQKIRDTMNGVTSDLGRIVGKQSIAQGDGGQLDMAQPGTLAQETAAMEELRKKVAEVVNAVEAKNKAFAAEADIVKATVGQEIIELNELKIKLEELKTFIGTMFSDMVIPEDVFKSLAPILEQVKVLSAELQTLHNNFALQGASDTLSSTQQSSTWLAELSNNIDEIARAIDAKTAAFKQEDEVVRAAVQAETESLTNLKGLLTEIQNVLQTIFSVDVQKFGNVDFEQDKNNVNAVSGVLKNIQQLLGQIYGVLKGFTGIEAQNENSLQAKAPVISGETRTDEQVENLSILNTILGTLQSIDNYLKSSPFEPIKTGIDQLTEVTKAKESAENSEKARTKDSISQLVNTLTPAVKTLQDVAKAAAKSAVKTQKTEDTVKLTPDETAQRALGALRSNSDDEQRTAAIEAERQRAREQYEAELQAYNGEKERKRKEIERLNHEAQQAEDMAIGLSENISTQQSNAAGYEAVLTASTARIEMLRKQHGQTPEEDPAELRRQAEEQRATVNNLDAEISALEASLAEDRSKLEGLQNSGTPIPDTSQDSPVGQIANLVGKAVAAQGDLTQANGEVERLMVEREQAQEALDTNAEIQKAKKISEDRKKLEDALADANKTLQDRKQVLAQTEAAQKAAQKAEKDQKAADNAKLVLDASKAKRTAQEALDTARDQGALSWSQNVPTVDDAQKRFDETQIAKEQLQTAIANGVIQAVTKNGVVLNDGATISNDRAKKNAEDASIELISAFDQAMENRSISQDETSLERANASGDMSASDRMQLAKQITQYAEGLTAETVEIMRGRAAGDVDNAPDVVQAQQKYEAAVNSSAAAIGALNQVNEEQKAHREYYAQRDLSAQQAAEKMKRVTEIEAGQREKAEHVITYLRSSREDMHGIINNAGQNVNTTGPADDVAGVLSGSTIPDMMNLIEQEMGYLRQDVAETEAALEQVRAKQASEAQPDNSSQVQSIDLDSIRRQLDSAMGSVRKKDRKSWEEKKQDELREQQNQSATKRNEADSKRSTLRRQQMSPEDVNKAKALTKRIESLSNAKEGSMEAIERTIAQAEKTYLQLPLKIKTIEADIEYWDAEVERLVGVYAGAYIADDQITMQKTSERLNMVQDNLRDLQTKLQSTRQKYVATEQTILENKLKLAQMRLADSETQKAGMEQALADFNAAQTEAFDAQAKLNREDADIEYLVNEGDLRTREVLDNESQRAQDAVTEAREQEELAKKNLEAAKQQAQQQASDVVKVVDASAKYNQAQAISQAVQDHVIASGEEGARLVLTAAETREAANQSRQRAIDEGAIPYYQPLPSVEDATSADQKAREQARQSKKVAAAAAQDSKQLPSVEDARAAVNDAQEAADVAKRKLNDAPQVPYNVTAEQLQQSGEQLQKSADELTQSIGTLDSQITDEEGKMRAARQAHNDALIELDNTNGRAAQSAADEVEDLLMFRENISRDDMQPISNGVLSISDTITNAQKTLDFSILQKKQYVDGKGNAVNINDLIAAINQIEEKYGVTLQKVRDYLQSVYGQLNFAPLPESVDQSATQTEELDRAIKENESKLEAAKRQRAEADGEASRLDARASKIESVQRSQDAAIDAEIETERTRAEQAKKDKEAAEAEVARLQNEQAKHQQQAADKRAEAERIRAEMANSTPPVMKMPEAIEQQHALDNTRKTVTVRDDGKRIVKTEEIIGGLSKVTSQVFDDINNKLLGTTVTYSNKAVADIAKANEIITSKVDKVGNPDLLQKYNTAYSELVRLNAQYESMNDLSDDDIQKWNAQIGLVQQLGKEISGLITKQEHLDNQQGMPTSKAKLQDFSSQAEKLFKQTGLSINKVNQTGEETQIISAYTEILEKIKLLSNTNLQDADVQQLNGLISQLKQAVSGYAKTPERQTYENVSFRAIEGYKSSLTKASKGIETLFTPGAQLTQEQQEIVDNFNKIMAEAGRCAQVIDEGGRVELSALQKSTSELEKQINAYKERNNIANANATVNKKTSVYGAGVMNANEKRFSNLEYAITQNEAFKDSAKISGPFEEYRKKLEELRSLYKTFETTGSTEEDEKKFRTLSAECNKYAMELENVIKAYQKLHSNPDIIKYDPVKIDVDDIEARKRELLKYVKSIDGVDAASLKFDKGFRQLMYTVNNGDGTFTKMTSQIDNLGSAIVTTAGEAQEAKTKIQTFFGEVGRKFAPLMTYLVSMTGVEEIFQQIRNGIQYVRDIDLALTELKKVTNETEATYDAFLQSMSKTAGVVGSTVSELTTMAAEWSRLGYSIEEAAVLAESTAILLNVSEFEDATSASEALISTMQAFSYTANESQHVVDILNEVGNNYAISSDGLAIALQDSASALMEGGNNLEQAVAMIAAANRVVQDPNSVGAALRTISLRLRGTSVEV